MHNVAGDPADVYRARHALFRASGSAFPAALAGVDVLGVVESDAPPIERYDPGHPQADADGLVYAANVNAMEEMANMISASRSYQSNLEVINTGQGVDVAHVVPGPRLGANRLSATPTFPRPTVSRTPTT